MMAFPKPILSLVLACLLAACLTVAAPAGGRRDGFTLRTRQISDKLVFCHFMVSSLHHASTLPANCF